MICRDKQDENKVIAQCRDRHKDPNKFIFVLDDKDLIKLGELKLNEENEDAINDFINNKIKEIID